MSVTQILMRQSATKQRFIALSLLMTLFSILTLGLWHGLPSLLQSQSIWRHAARSELATLRGWESLASVLVERRTELDRAEIWKQFHVIGQGMSAGDTIQQEINAVFSKAVSYGVTIQPIELITMDGVVVAGVRATLSIDTEQLRTILAALRSHTPYLRLQRMDVTATQVKASYENPSMLVVMDVVGFFQAAAAAESSS